MTTLEDYKREYPKLLAEFEDLACKGTVLPIMQCYSQAGMARVFVNEINGKIKQMKKIYGVFTTSPSFKNHDFTSQIKMYNDQLREYRELYERLKAKEPFKWH